MYNTLYHLSTVVNSIANPLEYLETCCFFGMKHAKNAKQKKKSPITPWQVGCQCLGVFLSQGVWVPIWLLAGFDDDGNPIPFGGIDIPPTQMDIIYIYIYYAIYKVCYIYIYFTHTQNSVLVFK